MQECKSARELCYRSAGDMADEPELSPTGDPGSSDDETVRGDRESDHIADILEEVRQDDALQENSSANGTVIRSRYRELATDAHEDLPEDGPRDAGPRDVLPARVGSPIDSLLSIPDDTPSIQVCRELTNIGTRDSIADAVPGHRDPSPRPPAVACCLPLRPDQA